MEFGTDTGTQQQFTGTGFGGVAVHFGKLTFQFGGTHVVFFGRFEVGVDGVFLFFHRPQFAVTHHHGIQHVEFFERELILMQFTQTLTGADADVTCGGLQ